MIEEALHIAKDVAKRAIDASVETMKREVEALPDEVGSGIEQLPDEIGGDIPYEDLLEDHEQLPSDVREVPSDGPMKDGAIRHDENPSDVRRYILTGEETATRSFESVDTELKTNNGPDANDTPAQSDAERPGSAIEKIVADLSTPEGIKDLIERHPEKAKQWTESLDAINTLNDPEATPAEIRSAQAKISSLKGQLFETAAKDALADCGLTVEPQQRLVDGESGGTRPDVIAKNNTDSPIEVFGTTIQPSESMSIECKCGSTAYITDQLNSHIPNQLSGQIGEKVLLTTNDVKNAPSGLAERVCDKYNAHLVVPDISVKDVENAMKGVQF